MISHDMYVSLDKCSFLPFLVLQPLVWVPTGIDKEIASTCLIRHHIGPRSISISLLKVYVIEKSDISKHVEGI
jgi:hypothetical protein